MGKQKKNSNYVTEKTIAAAAKKEEEQAKKKRAKTIKIVAISVGSTLAAIALIVGLLFILGAFDYVPPTTAYVPRATAHVNIDIEGYGTLHVELYGEDAPETVDHFLKLVDKKYFDGKNLHTLKDGLLYGGDLKVTGTGDTIFGEFISNGFENRVKIEQGVLAMARGDDYNSAYGQFFIATKDATELSEDYCGFGKITNYEIIEAILADVGGEITGENAPKIKSITYHAHH